MVALGESEQRRALPAPVPPLSLCANFPLGCSASDYEALPDDLLGLLYDCARQGKVNNIRFVLDIWSWWQLHLACANGHAGLMRLLLSHVKWVWEPRLDEFKVEDNERTRGRHNERMRRRRNKSRRNNQPAQEDKGAAE